MTEVLTFTLPHGRHLRYRPLLEEGVSWLGAPVCHRFVLVSYDDRPGRGPAVRDYACTTCGPATPHGKSVTGRPPVVAASEDGLN